MHAFFLTEAFTIIEAIHYITQNQIQEADAYVINVTGSSGDWAMRIRETNIFRNVYFWDNVLLTYPIALKNCIQAVINGRKLVRFMKDKVYDYAYYNNGGWLVNSIFYTGIVQNNSEAVHIYLEHGFLTYTTQYANKPKLLGAAIRMAGFRLMSGRQLDSFHVFEPDLLKAEQCAPIKIMPHIDAGNDFLVRSLNHIFAYKAEEDDIRDKDIIIMEQPPYKVEFDVIAFWKPILEILDLERTVLKAHPRQKECVLKDENILISRNHTIPWEVNLLNYDISEKVQMAVYSSACISPKTMFGEEPVIILLYKLLPVDYSFLGEEILEFTDAVARSYRHRKRFFVPETLEELRSYCIEIGIAKS